MLHGKNGEDGSVQGLCQLAGIPLAGCGTLSSALCMNKYMAHLAASAAGIKVPECILFKRIEEEGSLLKKIEGLHFPLFVKPVKAGSSFDITKIHKKDQLYSAVKTAFDHDDEVLVEENVDGFEAGCICPPE